MARSAALLLLLAVVASQLDLSVTMNTVLLPFSGDNYSWTNSCSISFYGQDYNSIRVLNETNGKKFCFIDSSNVVDACLTVIDLPVDGNLTVTLNDVTTAPGSELHRDLPNIDSNSTCFVSFEFSSLSSTNTDTFEVAFYNFGAQSAVKINSNDFPGTNFTVLAEVGNSTLVSREFNGTMSPFHIDTSGCRRLDAVFAANEVQNSTDTCSTLTCTVTNKSSRVHISSNCVGGTECAGNNTCVPSSLRCSITASSVIDFFDRVREVQDRCPYALLISQGSPAFRLSAGFKERHRKDVPFLDTVNLQLYKNVSVSLKQGGRVLLNGQPLELNSTAMTFHGVELSKDPSGVTLEVPFLNLTVFFDGYTALVSGPGEGAAGLCGNPTNSSWLPLLTDARLPTYSSCHVRHNDTTDRRINCTIATDHCNLLMNPAFAKCHTYIDPAPYITSCVNTLCKYPMVDGLDCQFLEAYAKSCSLINITLGNWSSLAGCPSSPQAFCQDKYCSEHEFCGDKRYAGTRCFCRAIFASKYRAIDALGEPTNCTRNSASLQLANCLLEDRDIDFSILHLNDRNCTGDLDNATHMVTFNFDDIDTCGTEVMMNNSEIIYKNTIMSRNSSSSLIVRNDEVSIDFSCYYPKPDLKTVALRIRDSSVVQQIISGVWNYTVKMNAYTDPARTLLIKPSTQIQLNQKVWVELDTEGLDAIKVSVVTDSCWATSQPSPTASPKYDLIKNRCANPADGTVRVVGNGQGMSNYFSFNMFQFSGSTSDVYLHCKLELCLKRGNSCDTNCGGGAKRRRRSLRAKQVDASAAIITMAWTN